MPDRLPHQSQPPPGGTPSGSERSGVAPATPPRDWKGRTGRAVAWCLAITLVMLPMGIAYLRRSAGDESYAIGYALGTGLVVLFLAALAQAVHARVAGNPAPLPLFLGVAALVGIGTQFALRAEDRSNGLAGFTEMVRDCQASDPEPFGRAPAGTRLIELPAVQLANFRSNAAVVLPPGLSADDYVIYRIVAGGQIVGAAVAYPGVGADEEALAGWKAGVTRGAVAAGGSAAGNVSIADGDAVVAQAPGGAMAVAGAGCWGVAVMAPTQGAAVSLGESLLAS